MTIGEQSADNDKIERGRKTMTFWFMMFYELKNLRNRGFKMTESTFEIARKKANNNLTFFNFSHKNNL